LKLTKKEMYLVRKYRHFEKANRELARSLSPHEFQSMRLVYTAVANMWSLAADMITDPADEKEELNA